MQPGGQTKFLLCVAQNRVTVNELERVGVLGGRDLGAGEKRLTAEDNVAIEDRL